MTLKTAPAPAPDPEELHQFTTTELDERDGSVLYVGGLMQAFAAVLDVTDDPSGLELIEFVNHLEPGQAINLLAAAADMADEVRSRLVDVIKAFDSAIASGIERVNIPAQFASALKAETEKGNADAS